MLSLCSNIRQYFTHILLIGPSFIACFLNTKKLECAEIFILKLYRMFDLIYVAFFFLMLA